MAVAGAMVQDDGGFTSIPTRGSNNASRQTRNRIYIGNLPTLTENELQEIIATRLSLPSSSIAIVHHALPQNSATISIAGMAVDAALSGLRGLQARGNKLVVHRDKNTSRGATTTTHGTQPSFGAWAKPKQAPQKNVSENMESLPKLSDGAAALSDNNSTKPVGSNAVDSNAEDLNAPDNGESTSTPDFATLCQNPLSKLLEDYGEEDPDWMNQIPVDLESPTVEAADTLTPGTTVAPETINRLQRHGMAPIHVEFVSFGYRHGIPADVRVNATGHSHRQPLVAFDSRTSLEEVPPYLAWMDGLSGAVKNTMIRYRPNSSRGERGKHHFHGRNRRNESDASTSVAPDANEAGTNMTAPSTFLNVRDYAHNVVAAPVGDAVVAAMAEHGYANPLSMSIYIGSELGRHRSVVAAEQAGTALRKLLRENSGDRFSCAVSVGCRHRDIDRKTSKEPASKTSARVPKQRGADFDDE